MDAIWIENADTISRAYLPYERLSTSTDHEIETINMIEDVELAADSIASIRPIKQMIRSNNWSK